MQSAQIEQFALWSKVCPPWEWKLTIIYDKRRKYRDYQDLAQIHRRVTDEYGSYFHPTQTRDM